MTPMDLSSRSVVKTLFHDIILGFGAGDLTLTIGGATKRRFRYQMFCSWIAR
jgi:hypothetical protein